MSPLRTSGATPLERLRRRYENTKKKCPECGYVDEGRSWTSQTNGRKIVYLYTCPSCGASREHTYDLTRGS